MHDDFSKTVEPPKGAPPPGPFLGWLSVYIGLFLWPLSMEMPYKRHVPIELKEILLHEAVYLGSFAAVAFGLALRAFRVCRPRWVGFTGMVVNAYLVLMCLVKIARPLLR